MNGGVCPAYTILSVTPARLLPLVHRRDAITDFEVRDSLANLMNYSSVIIALVDGGLASPILRSFPSECQPGYE
jgi:hypothetical protein